MPDFETECKKITSCFQYEKAQSYIPLNFKEELSFQFSTYLGFTLNSMLGKIDLTGSIMSIIPNLISWFESGGYQNRQKREMFFCFIRISEGEFPFYNLL